MSGLLLGLLDNEREEAGGRGETRGDLNDIDDKMTIVAGGGRCQGQAKQHEMEMKRWIDGQT